MTNLQLMPVRPRPQIGSQAEIVTLDRTEGEGITLRFLSQLRTGRGYGRQEVTLNADVAERLLEMLTRELDGDVV